MTAIRITDGTLTLEIDDREFPCCLGDRQLVIDYPLGGLLLEFRSVPFRFRALDPIPFQKNHIDSPARDGRAPYPSGRPVRERVEFGAHAAQQNSWAKTEAELHPIREVTEWR